jgi:hypothetical protein
VLRDQGSREEVGNRIAPSKTTQTTIRDREPEGEEGNHG